MLDIKDNSNLVSKAFQKFLGSRDSHDFLSQAGIWIVGYVVRKLRASEDEASLVFLKFWINRAKLIEYFHSKGFRNLFGFLACFSKNLLLNVRKTEQYSKTKEDFILSNEHDKLVKKPDNNISPSRVKLRNTLNKISILNRIIICLKYGIKLSQAEKEFLMQFLNNQSTYHKLMYEFESRIKERKNRELAKIEKLNFYQWKLLYRRKDSEGKILSRKRKLQNAILQLEGIFTIKELSSYLGISNYKIAQSCDYSLKFITQDLGEK